MNRNGQLSRRSPPCALGIERSTRAYRGKRASPTPAGKSGSIRPITTSPTRAARWSCSPAGDCDEARRLYPRSSESQGSRSYETVSQCYISPGCHVELERSICFSDTLRKADSSPAAQNDLATRSLTRRRSEEHTSELQSPCNLVCRLLLEK